MRTLAPVAVFNCKGMMAMKKMNPGFIFKASALAVTLFSMPAMASEECADLTGCDRKFCEMERQIEEAKNNGNPHKVAGLKKALSEAKENCTDEGLYQDLQEEVDASKSDLAGYEEDLAEARQDGEDKKVAKYLRKIQEEKTELEQLQKALSEYE